LQYLARERGGALGSDYASRAGLPVINISGCAPHPGWIMETLQALALGLFGQEDIDSFGRPRLFALKDRKLITFTRRLNTTPLLDQELSNMVHYQASVKASWDDMFNEKLGKTNWMITSKEKVKLITLFLDDGLLILSTKPDSDHDDIITKIKNLNITL
jgi:hypothetical protein